VHFVQGRRVLAKPLLPVDQPSVAT